MPAPDEGDVELNELVGDQERDAFIPNRTPTERYQHRSILTQWMPSPLRMFIDNLSRIKLVLILLAVFTVFLVLLGWMSNEPHEVVLPEEAKVLSETVHKALKGLAVPGFVLDYAPLVLMDRHDPYQPSDLATHVAATQATLNTTSLTGAPDTLSLANLHLLNDLTTENIYLKSRQDLISYPSFLKGTRPDSKTTQTKKAITCAVVVVDKGDNVVDAFYMYFYSFNRGPVVMWHDIGNHLGDWEHNAIRFKDGTPTSVWFSQHDYGVAYSYAAVQKVGKRPVVFSARGSHANYAKKGKWDLHSLNSEIPKNYVFDHTSYGALWDPTLSAYYYTFVPAANSTINGTFTPVHPDQPTKFLYFRGMWGDAELPDGARGQKEFHGFHKWTGGPQGPMFKHLGRKDICWPRSEGCDVLEQI